MTFDQSEELPPAIPDGATSSVNPHRASPRILEVWERPGKAVLVVKPAGSVADSFGSFAALSPQASYQIVTEGTPVNR